LMLFFKIKIGSLNLYIKSSIYISFLAFIQPKTKLRIQSKYKGYAQMEQR